MGLWKTMEQPGCFISAYWNSLPGASCASVLANWANHLSIRYPEMPRVKCKRNGLINFLSVQSPGNWENCSSCCKAALSIRCLFWAYCHRLYVLWHEEMDWEDFKKYYQSLQGVREGKAAEKNVVLEQISVLHKSNTKLKSQYASLRSRDLGFPLHMHWTQYI